MSELANDIEMGKVTLQTHLESPLVPLDSLDRLWKPVLMTSRAIGVFPYATMDRNQKVRWWRNWWNILSAFYVGAVVYFFANDIDFIVDYGVPKIDVGVNYLSSSVFNLHAILSTATFIYFLNCKPYLNDLSRIWSCLPFTQDTVAKLNADVKRKVRRNLALTVLGFVFYVSVTVGLNLTHLFTETPPRVLVMLLFVLWSHTANFVHLGLFCTVCRTSSYVFKSISLDLEAKLEEDSVDVHLKWFRDVFLTAVGYVEVSNKLFGRYVGFLVTFSLIHTCCNTYALSSYMFIGNVHNLVLDLFYAVEGLVIIIIVCLSAGEIVDQSGSPFRIMLKTDVSESPSNSQVQELMLMLDCSRTLEAKISMFGIMPITKESLPMIFGVYLSYVFLLYQFPQHSDKACSALRAANCTNATNDAF